MPHEFEHDEPLAAGTYYALVSTYIGVAVYGAVAAITGIQSLLITYGSILNDIWPVTLMLVALACVIGVYRTFTRHKFWLEAILTSIFIGCMFLYSVSIIVRVFQEHRIDIIPGAIIPLVICIMPYIRLLSILTRGLKRSRRAN